MSRGPKFTAWPLKLSSPNTADSAGHQGISDIALRCEPAQGTGHCRAAGAAWGRKRALCTAPLGRARQPAHAATRASSGQLVPWVPRSVGSPPDASLASHARSAVAYHSLLPGPLPTTAVVVVVTSTCSLPAPQACSRVENSEQGRASLRATCLLPPPVRPCHPYHIGKDAHWRCSYGREHGCAKWPPCLEAAVLACCLAQP